jgi:glycosyltransferase involved in cell wall biosynthesis
MNASSPLVSIIVPAYNAAPYLAELCDSIRAQTHPNFEALILDDGSIDNTREVLEPFRTDSRFKILNWSLNRGVNAATSALLIRMKGECWCNPGADDVLHPNFVAQRLAVLEAHPEAAMVHGPAEFIDAKSARVKVDFPNLKLPANMEGARALSMLLQHNIISTSSVMVRSDLTRLVLPHFLGDWKYAQDWYLWLLLAATGFDLRWDEQILHKYRAHENSLSGRASHAATRRAEIRLVPLCALSTAAQFSPLAARLWSRWRKTLYRLWLFRAFNLQREGGLKPDWLQLAARAFYGANKNHASLFREFCKHGLGVALAGQKERSAIQKQSFRVSGLAQINDPVFF